MHIQSEHAHDNSLCYNIMWFSYIEVIHRMLRPGGVWINLGPLLYHWVSDTEGNHDSRYNQSIEVTVIICNSCVHLISGAPCVQNLLKEP
jgi:N2227-like protein